MTADHFRALLLAAVAAFPVVPDPGRQQEQKHVALLVHGFNNKWAEEAKLYQAVCDGLFSGPGSMGVGIWFDWPSKGTALGYLPDRADARECAPDLADILDGFYDWLLVKERDASNNPDDPAAACQAKTSVIAHSMGNYLVQKAMYQLWQRRHQPLTVSLVNQMLMVAADVDNDLFKSGEAVHDTDGDGIANLTYRVTALYSGLDAVLGVSAGLKHFGKRRLGRTGLDRTCPVPDNVWDVDCTPLWPGGASYPDAWRVHSLYFYEQKTIDLMRHVLSGVDRGILVARGVAPDPV